MGYSRQRFYTLTGDYTSKSYRPCLQEFIRRKYLAGSELNVKIKLLVVLWTIRAYLIKSPTHKTKVSMFISTVCVCCTVHMYYFVYSTLCNRFVIYWSLGDTLHKMITKQHLMAKF